MPDPQQSGPPQTLPPDFFDNQPSPAGASASAPDTLPSDFFEKQDQKQAQPTKPANGWTGNESWDPTGGALSTASKGLGSIAGWAEGQRDKDELAREGEIARTGKDPGEGIRAWGSDLLGRAARMGEGLTSPKGAALGAASIVAPEVAGPYMIGEGVYNAIKHAPGALEGNPEEAGAALGGLSEATGGGALSGTGFSPKGTGIVGSVRRALTPTVTRAEGLSNRALFPREMPVGEQPEVKEEFGRVFRNVGPYTKAAPLPKGEGGALAGAQQVRQAAQNIWDEKVEPVLDSYGHVQRSTDDIAEKIRGTVGKTDRELNSPRVGATDKLASLYDGKVQTVRDMADRVTELNNDKAVSRFQNMDANGQSQALLADPALRGKVAELNGLRDKLFKTVGEEGGETLGDEFRESRKDWGALRNYEDRVLNAKVPTPQPLPKRIANTVRAVIGLKNDPLSIGAGDTLGRSDNPNRLIPRALNMAGKAGPAGMPRPSVAQQGISEPIGPRFTNRMLPASGESSFGNALDEKQAWDAGLGRAGGPNKKSPAREMPGTNGISNSGPLGRIPGKSYRSIGGVEVGPRTPVPPKQRLDVNEPASSIPLADIRAPLRAKLRAVIEDPAATQYEKSIAKQKLGKLYTPIGGR